MKTNLLLTCFFLFSIATFSQEKKTDLEKTIRHHDSIFWAGYNKCDLSTFKKYITQDFEFYHDKGGLTSGYEKFITLVNNGLCNKTNTWSLRREVVKNSTEVFPLSKYGGILKGQHQFYMKEKEKEEKLVEIARFTHVWKNENGAWKMSRVLSYDHQPAEHNSDKSTVEVSEELLKSYTGKYKAPKTGEVIISIENNKLHIKAGAMKTALRASSKTLFYTNMAPLTFEFVTNQNTLKIIVREQGRL